MCFGLISIRHKNALANSLPACSGCTQRCLWQLEHHTQDPCTASKTPQGGRKDTGKWQQPQPGASIPLPLDSAVWDHGTRKLQGSAHPGCKCDAHRIGENGAEQKASRWDLERTSRWADAGRTLRHGAERVSVQVEEGGGLRGEKRLHITEAGFAERWWVS